MTNTQDIEVDAVVGVLPADSGWHACEHFDVAPAEYTRAHRTLLPGGRSCPPAHFGFTERGPAGGTVTVVGPVIAISAIRLRSEP